MAILVVAEGRCGTATSRDQRRSRRRGPSRRRARPQCLWTAIARSPSEASDQTGHTIFQNRTGLLL